MIVGTSGIDPPSGVHSPKLPLKTYQVEYPRPRSPRDPARTAYLKGRNQFKRETGQTVEEWLALFRAGKIADTLDNHFKYHRALGLEKLS